MECVCDFFSSREFVKIALFIRYFTAQRADGKQISDLAEYFSVCALKVKSHHEIFGGKPYIL